MRARAAFPRRGSVLRANHPVRSIGLALVILAGAAATAPHLRAQELPLARCYDLILGPWDGSAGADGDSLTFAPPPRILLDTLAARRGSIMVGMLLREAPGSIPSIHPFSYWQVNRDSIELVWSTGFAGLSARLPIERDTLRGLARTFSDGVHAGQAEASVSAAPVACEEPPEITIATQRTVPTRIRLRSGLELELGQRLEDVEEAELAADARTARLSSPLARPFVGVQEVQLMADDDGRIGIVRFRLRGVGAWESVLRAVAAEYGPPTSRARHSRDDLETETLEWSNRLASFSMHRSRAVGEPWHASIVFAKQRFRP